MVLRILLSRGPEKDLENLLTRMRQRLYPETIPVLGSYWLRTVYGEGHTRSWWKHLYELLGRAAKDETLLPLAQSTLVEIRNWIRQSILATGKIPPAPQKNAEPLRAKFPQERLAPYLGRLLNEWLSEEIARELVEDTTPLDEMRQELIAANCLERVLVRDHLSAETLEMLLQPELLSPRYFYPLDAEVFTDVVLALLRRTAAPKRQVMPATMLLVSGESRVSAEYRDAVQHAVLVNGEEGEEIQVPITAPQASEICQGGRVRIASVLVTMDGRWWQSWNLQSGDQYAVVYKPRQCLRIAHAEDHLKLDVPSPDSPLYRGGDIHLPGPFELFGREWRTASWEADGEQACMHLVFSRTLQIPEVPAEREAVTQRSYPASVDIAWTAFADAVAAGISAKNREPVEELRRADFVPLGRAVFELGQAVLDRHTRDRQALETQLRGIRFLESGLSAEYGRLPWRALPEQVRTFLLKLRSDRGLAQLVTETIDGCPAVFHGSGSQTHPPQAA